MPDTEAPSPRRQLAERIAQFIREHELDNPFGGEVSQDGRCYSILCAVPRYLDGLIRVFGPSFIQVQLQGPIVHGAYDAVYTSEEHCLAFLTALLLDNDEDAAYAIPTKAR